MLHLNAVLLALSALSTTAAANIGLNTRAAAKAQSYCSSSDRKYNLTAFDPPVPGPGTPGGLSTWQLKVDDTDAGRKQVVTGFGAAVTDATVAVINALPSDRRSALLRSLVTPSGNDFSLMRHTVASSDLSQDPAYSYDDNGDPNDGAPDPSLKKFALGARGTAMASLLKELRSLKSCLTILGSPWSPPGWMKLNKVLWGTTVNNNLNHNYTSSYAQYFVKYLQAFSKLDVPVDAITIQNEPLNSRNGMPTLYIYADESGKLIQENVGPALQKAGLNTSIWAYDHNTDVIGYPETVFNEAKEFVNTAAWHCYASNNSWSVLTDFHNKFPRSKQYMTECYTAPETPWNQASGFTIGPLQNWANGAIAWTLATDTKYGPHLSYPDGPCTTCRGLVVVDTAKKTYEFQVDYYMMGQYSKYIPKGATILSGSGSYTYSGGAGIQSVASINPDGTTTVVIENTFGNDVYVTTNFKSGKVWSGRVYAKSVVSWVLPKA